MKLSWKNYFLFASVLIVGGGLLFILVETVKAKNTGFEAKTLWDWMELLVIPFVLALGAFALNRSEKNIELRNLEARSKLEREISTDRQQETALQSYLDRMAELLLKENIRTTSNKEVQNVARIRTLTVLRGLDASRKGFVLRFLHEAGLVSIEMPIVNLEDANLRGAYLRNANLRGADLRDADLRGANLPGANLRNANLRGADLSRADLGGADLLNAKLIEAKLGDTNLSEAKLRGADLTGADLSGADLRSVDLRSANLSFAVLPRAKLIDAKLGDTDLSEADLSFADLSSADLRGAELRGANLSGANLNRVYLLGAVLDSANLYGAKNADEYIVSAKSLEGATMPDGTMHK